MQETNPSDLFFHQHTISFDLTLFFSNNKLSVTLKDFVEWVIYSKEYTEDDAGRQIHKKMDLFDVYTAFSQTKYQEHEQNINEKVEDSLPMNKYEFGTIVLNKNLPCYKIERGGKLTAYLNIIDIKTKKQATYESKLALAKARKMAQTEIQTQRSNIEKKTIFYELSLEIEKQRREKQVFFQKIKILQQQNKKLEQETTGFGKELKITKDELISKIQRLETNLSQIKQIKNKQIESVKRQLSFKYDSKLEAQNQQYAQKILQIKQELTKKLQPQTQSSSENLNLNQFEVTNLSVNAKRQKRVNSIREQEPLLTQINIHSNQQQAEVMVDVQNGFPELQDYTQKIKNHQVCQFLIQSLNPDLDFNTEWMVQLEDADKKQQRIPLISNTHIIIGSARCGKLGYTYYRKQQESKLLKKSIKMIVIDCTYHFTMQSFLCELVQQLARCMKEDVTSVEKGGIPIGNTPGLKKMIIENGINLSLLNQYIISRPNLNILLAIKNCDLLVKRQQLILYHLFDWIRTEVRQQIGYVLMTRIIDFMGNLERRIKSRMNGKLIYLFGPQENQIIKKAIVKRIQFALQGITDLNIVGPVQNFINYFSKSTVLDELLERQQTINAPKQIQFFLHIFKISLTFDEQIIFSKDQKQFDILIQKSYKAAKLHLTPYVQRQKLILQSMSVLEFIVMGIIRKMLNLEVKICFKSIKQQLNLQKCASQTKGKGKSFEFTNKDLGQAIKNLKRVRVIDFVNQNDMKNAEITSFMDPDVIKQAIEKRDDLLTYVRDMLS